MGCNGNDMEMVMAWHGMEMEWYALASEVTPRFLAGAEPNAHQFYVTI
jgi:hypothetical protein